MLLRLLFKGEIAAALLLRDLQRDTVHERIQLQRRLAPKLQGVTLCKNNTNKKKGYETLTL